jgi:hypothetical protein
MVIDPIKWLEVANHRNPKLPFTTPWFDGTTKPVRVGFYERHFTDSRDIGDWTMQYWDGEFWRARPDRPPHWRQVGDYPAWRGLTKAQHDLQTRTTKPEQADTGEKKNG